MWLTVPIPTSGEANLDEGTVCLMLVLLLPLAQFLTIIIIIIVRHNSSGRKEGKVKI